MNIHTPSAYSRLDRGLHKLAFNSKVLQDILADIERSMYAKQWRDIAIERPVFITSLPRAGTTVVLQALNRLCRLATHTYRDMPFILTPLLWHRLSRVFRRTSKPAERAHGDGLAINEDSPEAFEEVLWKRHFPDHYHQTGIGCWQDSTANTRFEAALKTHLQKMVLLHSVGASTGTRYISKNNANIARIAYIRQLFPDAQFVVPLRHPVEQAVSLLRQHRNFVRQHAQEPFTRQYMADIGHYEFGELHRPIRFSGLAELVNDRKPDSLDYWLAYWIAAYREVSHHQGLCFINFEDLCEQPATGLVHLLDRLGLKAEKEPVEIVAQMFKAAAVRRDEFQADPVLVEQAMACYKGLHD
ncbi:MAG: sulfotransferase [Xanthomonadales bacterium]|nr:sulfotransferase [Xanthomonadales bacterium]